MSTLNWFYPAKSCSDDDLAHRYLVSKMAMCLSNLIEQYILFQYVYDKCQLPFVAALHYSKFCIVDIVEKHDFFYNSQIVRSTRELYNVTSPECFSLKRHYISIQSMTSSFVVRYHNEIHVSWDYIRNIFKNLNQN